MSEKYIYAFVHIPKTAGYTLRYHLLKNFDEEQMLSMSSTTLKLNTFDFPRKEKTIRIAAKNYITRLSKDKRKKIDIIYGHFVHTVLEKYFDRKVRYITFIREPHEWLYSLYKHFVRSSKINPKKDDKNEHFRKVLLVDGKIPNYSTWLVKKYGVSPLKDYSNMAGFLNRRGFSSSFKNITEALVLLRKFYFVGLTKNFTEESLFLYDLLGVNKFFFDQNISVCVENKKTNEKERGKKYINEKDINIYKAALEVNRVFKVNNPAYYEFVRSKGVQRKLLLPLTQTLFAPRKTLIRLYEKVAYDKPFFVKK